MRAQTVDITESSGRILCCTIFRPCGKKLLSKGHILNEEDVRLLQTEGMEQVWVTQLEDGEVSEDDAVVLVGREVGSGSIEVRVAPGGRANLFATEDCCVLVDEDLLKQINCTASVVIATLPNLSYALGGQRIATIKSTPFAVAKSQLEAITQILKERGAILQARPIRKPTVGVLYSDPLNGDKARSLFEPVVKGRLERYGISHTYALSTLEDETEVTRGLQHLLRTKPTAILVASTTAPAGPEDVVGRAIARLGCHIERFLAPVEPGNLLLLAYKDDVPIISAPGCYRSQKTNVVDLLIPPALAKYRLTGWEVACLGHGGLLG
jgi:molybdenum cofactor cytidylyltransferase